MIFYFSKILIWHRILWKGTVPFESGYTKFHTRGSVASYSFILYTLFIMSCEHGLGMCVCVYIYICICITYMQHGKFSSSV